MLFEIGAELLVVFSAGQVVGAETEADLEHRLDLLAAEAGMTRDELAAHFEQRVTPIAIYDRLREVFAEMEELGITRFYLQGGYDPASTPEFLEAVGGPSQ